MAWNENPKIVFFGTGAIGGSTGAWVAAHHAETYLLSRGKMAEAIRAHGLATYLAGQPDQKEVVNVKLIGDLDEVPDADVVVIGVKLYDLDDAARYVRQKLGDRPLVVGMQNGIENQKILPRHFSRVGYCVVTYNAWIEAPGVIGYQTRGPLLLGTLDNDLQDELHTLAAIFNPGVKTRVTQRLADAAHCKLVINLANAVTTLVGFNVQEISDLGLFQKVLSGAIYEGVDVIRSAGYHEMRLDGIPSWTILWASAQLPQILTGVLFRRNLSKMTMSSMAQDVFQRKSSVTELEYLNGYLLSLAGRTGVHAPYNGAIYRLCKENFATPDFQPLDVKTVWKEIQAEIRAHRKRGF